MRKTKIVCTIGPACDNEDTLTQMCLAGMNVARLNFSHGTHEEHRLKLERIKRVRERLNLPIAIMLDTKGPEYRTGCLADGRVMLAKGDRFTFTAEDVPGDRTRVSVSYKHLARELEPGDTVLVNNGLMVFNVLECTDTEVRCEVVAGGELTDHKSMSFPGKVLKQTYLSEQDKADIRFGVENDVDFIACSFVSRREDLDAVNAWLDELGAEDIDVIAKLENRSGVDNIEEICEACDGIMIGRGDMGVEIPFEELPQIQKQLITKCRLLGKRVITATEMLESMIHNVRPTRAEISDVANAVFDGTSCVMLSGETAAGKYPIDAVSTMSDICKETERYVQENKTYYDRHGVRNVNGATGFAAVEMADRVNAKCIIVPTHSGRSARLVSKFRPNVPLYAMSPSEEAVRRTCFYWGVYAFRTTEQGALTGTLYNALTTAKQNKVVESGDIVVLTAGDPQTSPRQGDYTTSTNLAMIAQVQ